MESGPLLHLIGQAEDFAPVRLNDVVNNSVERLGRKIWNHSRLYRYLCKNRLTMNQLIQ